MATPRRPYVRVRLGYIDEVIDAGCSSRAALLLARLITHRDKRSIPGLLRMGVAGLAESLGLELSPTKQALAELERGGFVRFDKHARLIYCTGAVEADPPSTENAVRGMAAQVRDLERGSTITSEVRRAIAASLGNEDDAKASKHLALWRELTEGSDSGSGSGPESVPKPRPDSGPEPGPLRDPRSEIRDPPAAAAGPGPGDLHRRAWSRLPQPPFAAAADELFERAEEEIPIRDFDALVKALAVSKWRTGKLDVVPTLRKLLDQPDYRIRIVDGEFAALSQIWGCPDCRFVHEPSASCAPKCRHCGEQHGDGKKCPLSKLRELREQFERDAKSNQQHLRPQAIAAGG